MATLKDISRHLNLSVTTVSRALNGFPEVKEETRKLVEKAAKELNYQPNQLARKLVTGKSGMVCMIIKDSADLSSNTHFMKTITGLSRSFSEKGMHFILHVSNESDPLEPYRLITNNSMIDGYILTRPKPDDKRIDYLREKNIPFVMHGRLLNDTDYPYYDICNHGVAFTAANHLLDLGHQNITFINGPSDLVFAIQRRQGFIDALKTRDVGKVDIHHRIMTLENGYEVAKKVLADTKPRPTAFMCSNTLLAKGAYLAVVEAGLKIPDDISVIAHDDAVPYRQAVDFVPTLTTTYAPLKEAFDPLAKILLQRINNKNKQVTQLNEVGGFELIVRESTDIAKQ